MELSFSIREYTTRMRSSDVGKCWPFDPEEENRSLPLMDVRKFRWWSQELDRRVKQRSPKKRSITELFATAPQIRNVEPKSDGPDENHEHKLDTADHLTNEALGDEVETKRKSKRRKKKFRSEKIKAAESKSDDLERKREVKEEAIKKRRKKEKKLKKKKKLEVQIHCKKKDNTGDPMPSKLDVSCEITEGDHEIEPQCHTTNTEIEQGKPTEEPDEVLIPLITILKKCKRERNHGKKGKGVTFSGVDAIIDPHKNEETDAQPKCTIDLNEALPESIDLNCCLEDHFTEVFNGAGTNNGKPGSPKADIYDETSSLLLNSTQQMRQAVPDFTKTSEPVPNLNSDFSTISMSENASPEQPAMVPRTVRLLGKNVTVANTDLKAVSTDFKGQEAASSSHASSSYCSDGIYNNNNNNNSNNCVEMNFVTGQFTSASYMPAGHYITANPAPVISFPVVPTFNFYHPRFPVVSPPMISFPLGGSIFPQPYGLNFSGFRDRSYNSDNNCGKMGSVEKVNVEGNKEKDT